MSNIQYRVARGRSVVPNNGPRLKEGDLLTADMIAANNISDKWLEDQHREGFVEPVTTTQFVTHGDPNRDVHTPQPIGGDSASRVAISDPGRRPAPPGQSVGGLRQTVTPFTPPQQNSGGLSKWNLDPATLHGKDIGQLNVMVQERDVSVPPFSTTTEAIAFLSRDFRPRTS